MIFFYLAAFITEACILVWWTQNPEFTEMQVFLKFWYWHLFSTTAVIVGWLAGGYKYEP